MGPEGLEGQVGSSASPQAGLEAQEGSEGANPEVLEVGHLADPEVGCLVGLEVDHPEDTKGGYLVVQVVDSDHLGWPEAALEEGGKSDQPRSLGRNKILG